MLHLAVVLRRLAREPQGATLGRALLDAFGRDMDHNLREMGVGDLAVPKQIRRMMEAFYGRARSYEGALAGNDPAALVQALARNVFAGGAAGGVARLADYVRRAAGQLDMVDGARFLHGLLAFPEPHAILAGDADDARMIPEDEVWKLKRMNKPQGWHVPVHLENIPGTGLQLDLDADEEVRERLAAIAGVRSVSRLHASVALTRHGEGLRAAGRVSATVGQTCVVSLEPLENDVDEPFDVLFVPNEAVVDASAIPMPAAEEVDDTRETLMDGTADIGAVAAEFFLLGIDRYPRKPGAVFAVPVEDRTGDSPFAVLAKLKPAGDKA